jgi:uncharacterized protein with HEPN domain
VIEEKLGLYLRDILEAAEKAVSYSEGLSYSTFLTDTRTQQAIAMNFIIIGECVARIIQSLPSDGATYLGSKCEDCAIRLRMAIQT